jgi:phage I-like protein
MHRVTKTTVLAQSFDGPAAPLEVQVIPLGSHKTEKGIFTLDAQGMKDIIGDFQSRANDMVIDYEHQSLGEGEAPAAGWIKRLIAYSPSPSPSPQGRGDKHNPSPLRGEGEGGGEKSPGIWAVVEWTPRAIEYLKNREYRYLSPVFMKRTEDNRVVKLLGAALTNTPAIDGMVPVVNKNQGGHGRIDSPGKEGKVMTKLLSALGLTAGATEEEALKSLAALKNKSSAAASGELLAALGLGEDATVSEAVGAVLAMKQAAESLGTVSEEMAQLKARLSANEAGGLVAQAMSEGKITPAQKEWAAAYAESDPEGFKIFVSRSPIVVPRGEMHPLRTQTAHGPGDSLQFSVNRLLMVSDEAFNKFSKKEE